ncbi:MAG: YicC family protein, partial [Proteobacteria bacterium]|nr:YicC family protein [Pseudomonadota bacterium]
GRAFPEAAPLRLADVLRWPGVLADAPVNEDAIRAAVETLARRALEELCAAREREGAKLAAIILERVAQMRERVAQAGPLVPEAIAAWKARVAERLREAQVAVDEERIRAELAVQAARSDVDEELTRLGAHLSEVERVLAKGGAAGKRLDFLAQELNREANTLASKAQGLALADCALELKLLIEQVREQVQNIE